MPTFFRVFIPEISSPENIYKPLSRVLHLIEQPVEVAYPPAREERRISAIVVSIIKRSDRKDLAYFDDGVTPRKLGEELGIGVIDEFEIDSGDDRKGYLTVFGEETMKRKFRGKDYGMLPHLRERLHTFGSGELYQAEYPATKNVLENGIMFVLGTSLKADDTEKRLISRLETVVGKFAISKESLMEKFKVTEDSDIPS